MSDKRTFFGIPAEQALSLSAQELEAVYLDWKKSSSSQALPVETSDQVYLNSGLNFNH